MAINKETARRVAAKAGKLHITLKGNSYKGIKLYDKYGKFHGTVIYQKLNNIENEKPEYIFFLHKHIAEREK